jgi:hypothetical protein
VALLWAIIGLALGQAHFKTQRDFLIHRIHAGYFTAMVSYMEFSKEESSGDRLLTAGY